MIQITANLISDKSRDFSNLTKYGIIKLIFIQVYDTVFLYLYFLGDVS